MEQKMKESQTSKKITEKNSTPEVLEELAKIPQEIIDKEAAQKYIEWTFFKSGVIAFVIITIVWLIIISGALYAFIEIIYEKGFSKDMLPNYLGGLFFVLIFIIGYIGGAYDLYLRYKVLKKNKEKNLN
jgi:hypothetical protein